MHRHIYCDESRQTKERFMVLGGIMARADSVEKIDKTMQLFRTKQDMFAELKWTKVSNQKVEEYRRFVNLFFALNNSDVVQFHSLIIDNHQVDHRHFNQGDNEIGFYKFYYQLLIHSFGRVYTQCPDTRFHLYLDYRNSSYSLDDLKTILNQGMRKKGAHGNPFLTVEPCDSKMSELMQINDIILGAIGFQKNGFDSVAGAKRAKVDLAAYIAERAGIPNLRENTPYRMERFTIWNFRLQKK